MSPMKMKLMAIALLVTGFLQAQSVEVKSKEKLPLAETAHNPILDESGKKILFTTEDYKGLKLYDSSKNEQVTVSTENGAGYKPVFTADGSEVYYRKTSYKDGFRYDALLKTDLKKMKEDEVVVSSRSLKTPIAMKNGIVVASEGKLLKTTKEVAPYATIEGNKIALYQGNTRTELQPCGSNVIGYVWPSVSPDGTKLLFHCAGKGTFVSDLKGSILHSLGAINAPVWYTNDFVVGMLDKSNDGVYTESKVLISSVDGTYQKTLTDQSEIALYPSVASKANNVAYSTLNGEIFILTLNIKK